MPKFKNAAAADKWAQITYGCSSAEAHRINTPPLQAAGGYAAASEQFEQAMRRIAERLGL